MISITTTVKQQALTWARVGLGERIADAFLDDAPRATELSRTNIRIKMISSFKRQSNLSEQQIACQRDCAGQFTRLKRVSRT